MITHTADQLLLENEELRRRLEEAEEALHAIRAGEVDAVVVEAGREQVFTLETADKPYRLLVEQMPHGAATLTVEGAVLYCNRRFADLLKQPFQALLGKLFHDFVAPDSRPRFEVLLRDAQAGEVQGEVTLQRGDGAPVPVYLGVNALQEGALGLCLVVTDLTEQEARKRAEREAEGRERVAEALRESEARFRNLLYALPVAVYTTDREGRITLFNDPAAELWGRRPDIGKDMWCGSWRIFRPDGTPLPLGECPMAVALHEGRSVRGQEIVVERPDGTRVCVLPYPEPLRDTSGEIIGAVNMLVDITDRKRTEEARSRLAAIVESSDDAIVTKNLEGTITSWNKGAERIFGYAADEIVGRPITLLTAPGSADDPLAILERIRRGEQVEHYRTVRRTKDGRNLVVSLTVSPVRDGAGRIIGASKIARDITEHERLEEALRERTMQLAEADRRKDEFLAMLGHELRNPLAAVSNAVLAIRLRGLDDPDLQSSQDVILRQTQQLNRLVDDLLDVSRISRGKVQLRLQPVELASVIGRAVETSQPCIAANRHQLTVTLPARPIRLHADSTRLAQVFANLLNNAAKYMEPGGRIWLTAERSGDEVTVRVRDAGVGIPPEMLPKVFDLFTQVDRSLDRSQGGLGIGLSLVQSLVQMHGGTVEARSAGAGQGSEFTVRLPVAAEELEDRGPQESAGDARKDTAPRKCRILVVDDHKDAADTLGMLLRTIGNEVHTVYDGLDAVAAAKTFQPDVVLLDIGLPKVDGYEAARRIREQHGGGAMTLVALTGWGQEEDRRRSKKAGFDHHLTKPVELAALQTLLARSLLAQ